MDDDFWIVVRLIVLLFLSFIWQFVMKFVPWDHNLESSVPPLVFGIFMVYQGKTRLFTSSEGGLLVWMGYFFAGVGMFYIGLHLWDLADIYWSYSYLFDKLGRYSLLIGVISLIIYIIEVKTD